MPSQPERRSNNIPVVPDAMMIFTISVPRGWAEAVAAELNFGDSRPLDAALSVFLQAIEEGVGHNEKIRCWSGLWLLCGSTCKVHCSMEIDDDRLVPDAVRAVFAASADMGWRAMVTMEVVVKTVADLVDEFIRPSLAS